MLRNNQNNKSKNNKKKQANLFGAACVALALLIILIAFLVKKDQISNNLKETAFFDRVFGNTPTFISEQEGKPKPSVTKDGDAVILNLKGEGNPEGGDGSAEEQTKAESQNYDSKITINELKGEEENPDYNRPAVEEDLTAQEETKREELLKKPEQPAKTENKPTPAPKPVTKTELQLCFTVIDADGSVVRKMIKRSVPKNDSPLTTAINLLLAGPDYSNAAERNLTSFIPKGTKLLGARVSNGVAYLNFSDNFEFNQEGTVGQINQLMQIVYTATNFSTVSSVQFLINGQKKQFLGEEGIRIDSPLNKNSF
ncbi:Sporulation and spore germination protein [Treponema sp. JC4]|uniref:GerMN domain-containing protein n=1 Tax=Treponema sp. JC4 TaxID=1124982 RepID=UPI00025B076B|nr:GerMN domain-containing protein [Treponema sp. JC4]EID84684.1 Sporulation and spore germination protein [Treponema sp. JC4]